MPLKIGIVCDTFERLSCFLSHFTFSWQRNGDRHFLKFPMESERTKMHWIAICVCVLHIFLIYCKYIIFQKTFDCCCCSVMSDSLQPHGLQHTRFPYLSPSPRVCSNYIHWVSDAIQALKKIIILYFLMLP